MSEPIIRLDRSKPFAECRGERTPDDPHYRVAFWQGQMVGKVLVQLPFDAEGHLVPDDGRTESYKGAINPDTNLPVEHAPLYTAVMRDLVERKKKRLAMPASAALDETTEGAEFGDAESDATDPLDDVNFVSYLKGEARYTPQILRAAAKKRYHVNFTSTRELVRGLVLDERVVPEDQVCAELAKCLVDKEAA